MQVRYAQEGDLERIVEIYNATVPSRMVTADSEAVSVESRSAWFKEHGERRPLWVAEDNGRVFGWLSCSSFYGRPAYARTVEVSIYLDSEYRSRGLGARLLQIAIDHSPALGIDTLLGLIFAHNVPSLRLFEKLGFERWGYLPKIATLDGVGYDLVIVGRSVARPVQVNNSAK